tara:strand:+ start:1358 stop:1618 length:261 start_codon:yes stop_codon:yes gene_type:complete
MAITKELKVVASVGLHARPAAEFVKLAQEFSGSVTIEYKDNQVDGKSMIGILKLAIKQGESFSLTLEGENEEEFIKNFENIINKHD